MNERPGMIRPDDDDRDGRLTRRRLVAWIAGLLLAWALVIGALVYLVGGDC